MASGLSGESRAISSALRAARCRLASLNSDAVTVPLFWPYFATIARLYPDEAPAVVTLLRAKRTLARSPPVRITCVSSALLNESALSVSAFACSRVQIIASPCRVQNVDLREPCNRTSVADRVALHRLPLAVAERAPELVGGLAAEHVERLPELRRVRLVGDVAQLRRDLPVLDLPEGLAAELEVVALVIDRVAAVTLDVDPVVGGGEDVGLADVLLVGLQRHVRHALEGHGRPVVGVAAAVRVLLPDEMRLVARGLVVDEHAVLDDRKARRLHAVVVVAAGGHRLRLRLVADDGDERRAELELAELVGGEEARAGEVRLVAERAIELRRMADRLVNRQPQVGRVQDQRLLSRRH